ncbi:MAG: neutral zinc metallopeptidase [Sterolibacterium sp.]|nr:neutral zinc metallopeptidase [Sterolibacterium sp.]
MRLDKETESRNVEDRRGMALPGGRRGGLGAGTIVIALLASYFFGIDPSMMLGIADRLQETPAAQQKQPARQSPPDDEEGRQVARILGSTERAWSAMFSENGRQYVEPTLVLFTGATPTACGTGQAAMGPFYCPLDSTVYIDLAFYDELKTRFQAPGDFAQAYVIAHEVGHHVQHLLGISDQVHAQQQRAGSKAQANALSVRLELQADCLAGVWAAKADEARQILEAGDVEEALAAATAIGDDRLQQQTQGRIVPDAFTHGSSAQRVRWFRHGLESGDINQCNTFQAAQL